MKSLRLCVLGLVGVAVVVLSGCQMPFKVLSRAEFERLKVNERNNEQQAMMISSLTNEKTRLQQEVTLLRAQTVDKGSLIEAQQRQLAQLQEEIERRRQEVGTPIGGSETLSVDTTEYGETRVTMSGDLLFASGSATLTPEGERILKEAADMVRDQPNRLAIRGYTDSDPIKVSGWKSNFELSGARALAVLNQLKKEGIPADRMYFAGYGEHRPAMENGVESKKRSRRAEIILLNEVTGGSAYVPQPVVPK